MIQFNHYLLFYCFFVLFGGGGENAFCSPIFLVGGGVIFLGVRFFFCMFLSLHLSRSMISERPQRAAYFNPSKNCPLSPCDPPSWVSRIFGTLIQGNMDLVPAAGNDKTMKKYKYYKTVNMLGVAFLIERVSQRDE